MLEPGCGSGRYLEALARRGLDVVGIDSSQVMVELARKRPDRAIVWIEEARVRSPLQAEWLLLRADAHAAAGRAAAATVDREAALAELDATLAHRPSDRVKVSHARALCALGRDAEAARELSAVVAGSPDRLDAQALLAAIHARLAAPRQGP